MFLENLLVFQSYNGAFAGHFELAFWLLPRVRRFRRVVFENRFVSLRRADSPLLVLLPDVARRRGVVLLSVMKRERRRLLARQVQLKMPQSPRVFAVQIFPASFCQRPGQHRWRVVRHPFCFLLLLLLLLWSAVLLRFPFLPSPSLINNEKRDRKREEKKHERKNVCVSMV